MTIFKFNHNGIFNNTCEDEIKLRNIIIDKGFYNNFNLLFTMFFCMWFILLLFLSNFLFPVFFFFILSICFLLYNIYSYIRSLIEVIVNDDQFRFRIYKKFHIIYFSDIKLMKIVYYSMWFGATIKVITKDKSNKYYIIIGLNNKKLNYFKEFVKLIEEKARGKFELKVNI